MALEGSIARRYARALLEIGVAQQNFEKMGEEIHDMAALFATSKELREALVNPVFAASQRRTVLVSLCDRMQITPQVKHFLLLLLERNRIAQLPDVAREMQHLVDKQAGRVRTTIVSAEPLPEEFAHSLRRALEARIGKKVVLEREEDPTLFAGLVAKIGDVVYDNSLRTQLEQAKEDLLAE